MKILVKCAWCNKIIGYRYYTMSFDPAFKITHSICSDCYKVWLSEPNFTNLSSDVTDDVVHTKNLLNGLDKENRSEVE